MTLNIDLNHLLAIVVQLHLLHGISQGSKLVYVSVKQMDCSHMLFTDKIETFQSLKPCNTWPDGHV